MKVKNKEFKQTILQEFQDSKQMIIKIIEILRSKTGAVSNVQIAQLNDLAYKGVRNTRLQKVLD